MSTKKIKRSWQLNAQIWKRLLLNMKRRSRDCQLRITLFLQRMSSSTKDWMISKPNQNNKMNHTHKLKTNYNRKSVLLSNQSNTLRQTYKIWSGVLKNLMKTSENAKKNWDNAAMKSLNIKRKPWNWRKTGKTWIWNCKKQSTKILLSRISW